MISWLAHSSSILVPPLVIVVNVYSKLVDLVKYNLGLGMNASGGSRGKGFKASPALV